MIDLLIIFLFGLSHLIPSCVRTDEIHDRTVRSIGGKFEMI
jgi:hypothetical protein